MRSLSSTSAAGGVGWLASAAGRRGGIVAADLPDVCPVMVRPGTMECGADPDGVAGEAAGEAAGVLVGDVAEGAGVGAGVGARRVLMRRLAARARISFMRSMV
jgi:hypothetical protein